jgi:hypothetical protein
LAHHPSSSRGDGSPFVDALAKVRDGVDQRELRIVPLVEASTIRETRAAAMRRAVGRPSPPLVGR